MLPLAILLLSLLLIAVGAGFLGALLGLGGGLIIVPALVLVFGVDVHLAVASSLVSVIATSSGSASRYARQGLIHLRLGFFLEIATALGGLTGAILTALVLVGSTGTDILFGVFAFVAVSAAVLIVRDLRHGGVTTPPPDPLADRWRLHAVLPATPTSPERQVRVGRVREGMAMSLAAGLASGLLGIGGGLYKVPAMTGLMGVPMKMASATSSMMIGITATSGAIVFLLLGDVVPLLTAPIAIGTLLGTLAGTRVHTVARASTLRLVFVAVLIGAAVLMLLHAAGVTSA
jgi:uncharacterized protein